MDDELNIPLDLPEGMDLSSEGSNGNGRAYKPFNPAKPRQHSLQTLRDRHMQILRLSSVGMKGTDIAEALHISPVTVYNTLSSQLGKEYIAKLREDMDEEALLVTRTLVTLGPKAVKHWDKVLSLEDGDVKDRNIAAKEVMTHIHKVITESSSETIHGQKFDPNEIKEVRERAKERRDAAIARGDIQEAVVVDTDSEDTDKS